MFYGFREIYCSKPAELEQQPLFQQSWRKPAGAEVTTALVINRRRHLCVCVSLFTAVSVVSMAHLQLSQQATREDTSGPELLFKYSLSRLILLRLLTERRHRCRKKNRFCLFVFFHRCCNRKTRDHGCVFASLSVCLSAFKAHGHAARSLLTEQPVGRCAERSRAPAVRPGPSECKRGDRWRSRRRARTHYLKPRHKSKWLTRRTRDVDISHTFCARIHKYLCVRTQTRLFCHTRVRARTCSRRNTKLAVCYSQAVETDLPQCLHCLMRGRGIQTEM